MNSDVIESFAADVAHELKNPLTSLQSATKVAPRLVKTDEFEKWLMDIIKHDVRPIDRLISDISDDVLMPRCLTRARGRDAG